MQLRQEKDIWFKSAFVETTSLQVVVVGLFFFFFLQAKFCPGIQQQGDACKVFLFPDETHQSAGTGLRLILPHQKVKGRCCENQLSSICYPGAQQQRTAPAGQSVPHGRHLHRVLTLPGRFSLFRVWPGSTTRPTPVGFCPERHEQPQRIEGTGFIYRCSAEGVIYRYRVYSEETAQHPQRFQKWKR